MEKEGRIKKAENGLIKHLGQKKNVYTPNPNMADQADGMGRVSPNRG